ncbi:MAG: 4Fe-4S dicluster-binding protein [archaeon]
MSEWETTRIGGVNEPATSLRNKTGSWRSERPVWDSKKCINCALCSYYCPEDCIPYKGGKRAETDFDYCKGCGICVKICPVKCIAMESELK